LRVFENRMLKVTVGPWRTRYQVSGENYIRMNLIICIPH